MPQRHDLDGYDFGFSSGISERQLRELCELTRLQHACNIILMGPSGTGKTYIASSLVYDANKADRQFICPSGILITSILKDKKSLRKCCRFRNLLYLCISWSRTRNEKPADYQDVRGEFRHVPPAITQLKTPLFGGVFWFTFANRFECQAFMFSIPYLFHVNIMVTLWEPETL